MNEYIEFYKQSLQYERRQANKWFDEINNLEAQLAIAKARYKFHKEESEKVQALVMKSEGKENEIN